VVESTGVFTTVEKVSGQGYSGPLVVSIPHNTATRIQGHLHPSWDLYPRYLHPSWHFRQWSAGGC